MKKFSDVAEQEGNRAAVRALQAWLFLIGKAHTRQIVRYADLAAILGYTDNRPLTPILGHIMFLCQEERLPPLTIIVVSQDGTPGEGFTQVPRDELDWQREQTFGYNWFGLFPPKPTEFKAAWDRAKKTQPNQVSRATSKPEPSAASSAPQS